MSDLKKTISALYNLSAIKRMTQRRGILVLYLLILLLSAIAFLAAFTSRISPPGYGTVLMGITTLLFLMSVLGYLTSRRFFRSMAKAKAKSTEEAEFAREKNKSLTRELAEINRKLSNQTEELKVARRQVEEKSKAKSEFLSSMSHEIRTPMNAIMGITNLLIQEGPRDDQLEHLEVLDFSAKSLLALITDVLDYSRIESGNFEFTSIAFNLENLIHEIVEDFRFTGDKNNITLYTEIAEDIPDMVTGDPSHLTQILSNLISNALKFTREGRVEISVEERPTKRRGHLLVFSIADTGVGISRENHDRIFDKFTQEENGSSRIFGGAGLGLTISKKLVELKGGKIYLESEKEIGSTFFVELLFDSHEEGPEKSNAQLSAPEGLKGKTILLVEDNPVNQTIMRRFLDKWEINCTLAEDGEQAVSIMKRQAMDLVLMDLQMPNMDGYEATRLIRQLDDSLKSAIPIIALTAAPLQDVKEKVFASGMDYCLTKPFNPAKLQRTLKQYMLKDPK